MGLKISGHVTVWNAYEKDYVIERKERYADVSFSTSSKNKQTDKYETDLRGKLRFVGSALEKVLELGLQNKDRVNIIAGSLNTYKSKDGITYNNFMVFDFEKVENLESATYDVKLAPKEVATVQMKLEPIQNSDLPF